MKSEERNLPKVGILDGYKPQQLRTYLDIDQSVYDYWKRELQPKLRQKTYLDGDVLAYFVMKEAILEWQLKVKWLKDIDWMMIFDACHDLPKHILVKYRFVFDRVSHEVVLLGPKEKNPKRKKASHLRIVLMAEIFEEFYESQQKGFPSADTNVVAEEELVVARLRKQSSERVSAG